MNNSLPRWVNRILEIVGILAGTVIVLYLTVYAMVWAVRAIRWIVS